MALKEKITGHILLVDDDPLIRSLGGELLGYLGFQVATAASGTEALESYQRGNPAPVVILDLNLPGLNGLEVMERLKTLDPGAKVLMASGFYSHQEMMQLREAGVWGFLHKPFRLEELRTRLAAVLGGFPET